MNPATAQASVIVDELVRCGVRQVVLCPGSRNAPLSVALFQAAESGRLTLHVRVDERAAGFLALGLATGAGHPAAIACTSGTAVANLHPAVLEAGHAGVGILLLTADRPPELRGTGANQTIDQSGLFGQAAATIEFPVAERRPGQNRIWRAMVCRAVGTAEHGRRPVQVNLPFREPLLPTPAPEPGSSPWPDALDGRPGDGPWTATPPPPAPRGGPPIPLPARTLMVLGSGRQDRARAAATVAAGAGWPVIAEPPAHAAALAGGAAVLRHGTLLIAGDLPEPLHPDAIVTVGRPTLSRSVRRLMTRAPVHAIGDLPQWTDPLHVVTQVHPWLAPGTAAVAPADPEWLPAWRQAEAVAQTAVDKLLAEQEWPTGLRLAADLVAALPTGANLFLGSSNPIRDVDLVAAPRPDIAVHANRGVAGIDGNVSTAAGLALSTGTPTYALVGDVTFLHDLNALLIGPAEPRPELTVVVHNDNGGGIFSVLEQGAPEHAAGFERVFGTPHAADLSALCAGLRVPHTLATTPATLRTALRNPTPQVIEVRTTRTHLRPLHTLLHEATRP